MPGDSFIRVGADGKPRCYWCGEDPLYVAYHDLEWGVPCHDDRVLFEKLCLEAFQAGLSWITILRKRPAFREAFDNFDPHLMARYGKRKIAQLLANPGIVRHRGKIEAVINNARKALELAGEAGSLDAFCWSFRTARLTRFDPERSQTPESRDMSKSLRKRGWKFVGPTTCYSFMQAMGIVNDHHPECFRHRAIEIRGK